MLPHARRRIIRSRRAVRDASYPAPRHKIALGEGLGDNTLITSHLGWAGFTCHSGALACDDNKRLRPSATACDDATGFRPVVPAIRHCGATPFTYLPPYTFEQRATVTARSPADPADRWARAVAATFEVCSVSRRKRAQFSDFRPFHYETSWPHRRERTEVVAKNSDPGDRTIAKDLYLRPRLQPIAS